MPNVIYHSALIFIIFFSCLFYGSVTTFPLTVIEALVGMLILVWLWEMAYKRNLSFLKMGAIFPLALFLGLVIFQLIPLPLNWIKLFSSKTAYLYERLIPNATSRGIYTLSLNPNATVSELFRFLTYIGMFFLGLHKVETKKQFAYFFNAIIVFGTLISLFGIIQHYSYSGKVYWFDPPHSAASPFGPFVNRNNFAGYINMIIPLALGYFLSSIPMANRVIYAFCVGIMSSALFLSLSRAGVLVYLAVLVVIIILAGLKRGLKTKAKTLLIWIFLVLLIFISCMEAKIVWLRLTTLFNKETLAIFGHGYSWEDILRIWWDFPFFGTGLGTFGSISSMYKTTSTQSLFTYAHNDYLQLLSETGLFGFISMCLFFILYIASVLKMWLGRHDSFVISLVLGGLASIFAMLVYSLLDFNLHIPANALLFFTIMGLVYRLVQSQYKNAHNG